IAAASSSNNINKTPLPGLRLAGKIERIGSVESGLFFAHNNRRALKSKLQFTNKLKLIQKRTQNLCFFVVCLQE
ncbi:MAG TPA: hypothetical protein VIK40_12145, partial [Geomonas sp.]